ncbi:MAG: oligosaccharide flippase family protein [Erysipelotrichales bacterium]|nr:oligosaccharide flippase family protein [Erysipelotrichales bacterium]
MKDNIRYNVIVNLIRTLVLTLLSFISFPYVCKALGANMMGTYTWANTFVFYFVVIARSGIPNVAIRECAKVQDDKEKLSKKVQEFFIIQAVLTVLSFVLMCVMIFSIKELESIKELIFILSINFVIGAFSFEWVFIALEKHYFISFRSIITLAISSILIISLVHSPTDIFLYAVLAILSTILTVIINCLALKKYITLKFVGKYDFKQYLKPISVVFIISLILTLYNSTDTFILGFLDLEKASVASYSVGIKSIEIIITLITSLDAVFIPRATKYYKMENKVFFHNLTRYGFNICLFIAIPAIVTMAAVSNQITTLISSGGDGYDNANLILIILVSMSLTFSLSDMIYEQVLLPMKKEKYYLFTMLMGTILNIGGSISLGLLFKNRPAIGVAIATMLADVVVLFNLLFLAKDYAIKALFNKNSLKLVIAGLFVGVSSLLLTKLLPISNDILQIVVVVLVGAVIYIGSLALMRENLVMSFINRSEKEQ